MKATVTEVAREEQLEKKHTPSRVSSAFASHGVKSHGKVEDHQGDEVQKFQRLCFRSGWRGRVPRFLIFCFFFVIGESDSAKRGNSFYAVDEPTRQAID